MSVVLPAAAPDTRMHACRYVQDYDEKNPATYKGLNLHTMPMSALYAHFGLDAQTIDFIGHALALHRCGAAAGRRGRVNSPTTTACPQHPGWPGTTKQGSSWSSGSACHSL